MLLLNLVAEGFDIGVKILFSKAFLIETLGNFITVQSHVTV